MREEGDVASSLNDFALKEPANCFGKGGLATLIHLTEAQEQGLLTNHTAFAIVSPYF